MFKRSQRLIGRPLAVIFLVLLSIAAAAAPPQSPDNPAPLDGANNVPLSTSLQWSLAPPAKPAPSAPSNVQLLVFTGHSDNTYEYPNMLAAIRQSFTTFNTVNITSEDPATLATMLADKQVFVLPEQETWSASGMAAFGTAVGPVLRQFVQNGGLVVACDDDPVGGTAQFLTNAGLMTVTQDGNADDTSVKLVSTHPITQGLSASFTAMNGTGRYSSVGDATVLVAQTSSNEAVAAIKTIGAGNVLLLGWDYNTYNTDMGRLLANAIKILGVSGGVSITNYAVYLSTSFPPTTLLTQGIYTTQTTPGPLAYQTTYYWQVIARNADGETAGPIWSFDTMAMPLPAVPANPKPVDQATTVPLTTQLTWDPGTIPATFTVLLDTKNPPLAVTTSGLTLAQWTPKSLQGATTYYWQVVAHNITGDTPGPVWAFTTPPPPPAPHDPDPADGALGAPLNQVLRWNTTASKVGKPSQAVTGNVQILVFTGYSDNSPTGEVQNTLGALRAHFTDFTSTTTTSMDPVTLGNQLAGKQVFLLPEQENWSASGMAAFSTAVGPVLKQFVQNGGLLVACDFSPSGGTTQFLTNAGLMNATYYSSDASGYTAKKVVSSHPVTQNVAATFTAMNGATMYSSVGDATALVADQSSNKPIVAVKTIGSGNVLLLGWDYYTYNNEMGQLLANAVQILGTSGGAFASYDVYFGTTNPPASPLAQGTYASQCAPGALAYSTTYYWRVTAHNSGGDTVGPVWSFRTMDVPPPAAPTNPLPTDRATFVPLTPQLSWDPGTIPATFTVLLDTKNPPLAVTTSGLTLAHFTPGTLNNATTYYWQVIAHNATADAASPVWSFTTPAPPPAPGSPLPVSGATNMPLNTVLQWNTAPAKPSLATSSTVQVLIFTGHSDNTYEYPYMLAAIRQHFTNFTTTNTTSEVPATLQSQLVGKQVFLLMEQENWSSSSMAAFGTAVGPVLRQFVQNGGLVVACDDDPVGGTAQFLTNAGLMTVTQDGNADDTSVKLVSPHPITQGVSSSFIAANGTGRYSSVGDATVLVAQTSSNEAVVAIKTIGAGHVLLLGWDYNTYNTDMGHLLASALQILGTSGGDGFTTYDVYFGTTNPPTTPLVQGTYASQCAPGALAYSTTYYWRVTAHNSGGDTVGPVWSFSTMAAPPPAAPTNPQPTDRATFVPLTPQLSWDPGTIPATFTVLLDTKNPPLAVTTSGLTLAHFTPGTLTNSTTYYWQVIAHNATADASSPVWSFTTPAAPPAPALPSPADGAANVPYNLLLKWNEALSPTVQILVFNGHSDNSPTGEYQNTLGALRAHFTDFTSTATTSEDPATLGRQLAGKQVFLLPEQETWSAPGMAAFGTAVGPVLRQFVQNGGLVVACDDSADAAQFLASAGLMNATYYSNSSGTTAKVVGSHPITYNIPSTFTAMNGAITYSSVGDATTLVAESSSNRPIVAIKPIGVGNVLLLGWDYYSYNNEMGQLLADAVQQLGHGSLTYYDLYFGTDNPPTTPLALGTFMTRFRLPSNLTPLTTYYWQVVAHNAFGMTAGPVWSFETWSRSAVSANDWMGYK